MPNDTSAATVTPPVNVELRKNVSCSMGLALRRSTSRNATRPSTAIARQVTISGDVQPRAFPSISA